MKEYGKKCKTNRLSYQIYTTQVEKITLLSKSGGWGERG